MPSVRSTIPRRELAGTGERRSVAALSASKIAVSPPAVARSIAAANAALSEVSGCGTETAVLNVTIAPWSFGPSDWASEFIAAFASANGLPAMLPEVSSTQDKGDGCDRVGKVDADPLRAARLADDEIRRLQSLDRLPLRVHGRGHDPHVREVRWVDLRDVQPHGVVGERDRRMDERRDERDAEDEREQPRHRHSPSSSS